MTIVKIIGAVSINDQTEGQELANFRIDLERIRLLDVVPDNPGSPAKK